MYNKIVLLGNLTKDIDIRYTPGGSAIGSTSIATSRKFKSQDGTQKEETMFIDVVFFGRSAEIAKQYARKGSKLLVEGRVKFDQWTAEDGSRRSKHSVVVENFKLLDSRQDSQRTVPVEEQDAYGNTTATYSAPAPQPAYNAQPQQSFPGIDINEDEIPF